MLDRVLTAGVLAASVALMVWGAHGYHERDQVVAWAEIQCGIARAPYKPPAKSKAKPGEACGQAITDLANFKDQATTSSNEILAGAVADQAQRNERATVQARAAAVEAQAAAKQMDDANAKVQADDRVGHDWFDALNRAGGLRDPAS